jgi:hypothetical protein
MARCIDDETKNKLMVHTDGWTVAFHEDDFIVEESNSRLLDAKIAVEEHGWRWAKVNDSLNFLIPPENDERINWAGAWDENGIPHYLPKYSQGEK